MEYLRISYQVHLLRPYHRDVTSSVVKSPKLYWLDVGVARQLCGFRGDATGELFETYVVTELVKWMRTAQRDGDLYFYRTRSGLEVDVLLETQDGIVGFEIKATRAVGGRDLRGLRALRSALGDTWRGGVVVYRGDRIERFENGLWAVPSRRLFA